MYSWTMILHNNNSNGPLAYNEYPFTLLYRWTMILHNNNSNGPIAYNEYSIIQLNDDFTQ